MSGLGGRALEGVNAWFDAAVDLHIRVGVRRFGSWRLLSVAGFAVAVAVWTALGLRHRLPLPALVVVAVLPALIAWVQQHRVLRSGRPARLVLHRYLAVSTMALVPVLAIIGSLTPRLIAVATAATMTGVAVGRLGCFRSGCCTGRRSAVGPHYPWLPAIARRCPVQLLEAAVCAVLAVGVAVRLEVDPGSGVAAALGWAGYGVARFGLDELRAERRSTGRHTEAQKVIVLGALIAVL